MKLTKIQKRAADHLYGPALVLAVPGAGKTTMLLERIKILSKIIDPKKILTLTFSKDQSVDMKNRYKDSDTNFMTIHAFCYLIIRNYLKKYKRSLRLLESNDSYNKHHLVRDIYKKVNNKSPSREDIEAFFTGVSYMNNAMETRDYLKNIRIKNIEKIYDSYEAFKKSKHFIDFDDMQILALKLLRKDPRLLRSIQNKYEFFQLDEGQDTSLIQFKILKMIVSKNNNLMVVADDDQSIYSFRAADPAYLLNFKDHYKGAKIIFMDENHRSSKNISQAASAFIRQNEFRYKKSIVSNKEDGDKVVVKSFRDSRKEYDFIIKNLDRSFTNAILFRNNITAINLVSFLLEDGISFSISEDFLSYFKSQVIGDFVDIINFSEDFYDSEIFSKIYYKIGTYLKKEEVEGLSNKPGHMDVFDYFYEYLDYDRASNLHDIEKKLKHIRKLSLDKKISYIYSFIGYKSYARLRANKFGEEVMNKDLFIESLVNFSRGLDNLADFYQKIEDLKKYIKINKDTSLTLQTIHKSKGLEYDRVFVVDLIKNEFPIIDYDKDYLKSLEEERRIFYVAMTRAKSKLFILSIKRRNKKKTEESEFYTYIKNKA